ncbi:MAG: hypothetical protein HYX97_06040 [Chloroflexi bacterium]|nr:hypothetical protein [Chloroflexota bacterium]
MKLKSFFGTFLHCEPGRHQVFNAWHDYDHRPENHGQIPHIYHSQRWIATPELMEARAPLDPAEMPYNGGQYFASYWSTAGPEQLEYDIALLRSRLMVLGRNNPINNKDFKRVRPDRYYIPLSGHACSGLALSAEAVPLAPHTAIVVMLVQALEADQGERWIEWCQATHVKDVLTCAGFAAAYVFKAARPEHRGRYLLLYYLDADPLEAMADVRRRSAEWHASGRYPKDQGQMRRSLILSAYHPITPGGYDGPAFAI